MRRDLIMSFFHEYGKVEPIFYRQMKDQQNEGIIPRLKKAMKLFSLADDGKCRQSDILFISHSRRMEIDGKLVCIYTDYVADRFPGSLTLQRIIPEGTDRNKVYSDNMIYIDRMGVKASIYKYLVRFFHPGKYRDVINSVYSEMKEPFEDLNDNYGLHPDINLFSERVASLYFFYKYKKPRLEKMLKKISPKVIVEVVGGSFDAKIINEIAAEKGIETVELQHGTNQTWFPDDVFVPQVPKWFFSFGDFWSSEVKLPIPDSHVLPMGFPYHDIMMAKYPQSTWKKDVNTIIFLSSKKYGDVFSRVALELKRIRPELHIIYKLHPREYADHEKRFSDLKESGVDVISDNKTSLYQLFSECSMQVGVESTAIYEGLGFGLRTFIWNVPMASDVKGLVEKGYAVLFNDAGELAELVDKNDKTEFNYDVEDIWKVDSLNNIEKVIRNIISKKVVW